MVAEMGIAGEELMGTSPDFITTDGIAANYDTNTLTLTFDNWTSQTPGQPGSYGYPQENASEIAQWNNFFE